MSDRLSDQLWIGLLFFLAALSARQVPVTLTHFMDRQAASLSEGTYLLSAGTPQTLCDLSIGGKTLATNRMGSESTLGSLVLSGTFHSSDLNGTDRSTSLSCEKPKGYSFLIEPPSILPIYPGMLFQTLVILERIILPSLLTLLALFFITRQKTKTIRSHRALGGALFVSSLVYSGVLLYFIEPPALLFLKTFAACIVGFILPYWVRTQSGRYQFFALFPAWITLAFGLVCIFAPIHDESLRLGVIYGLSFVASVASFLFVIRTRAHTDTLLLLRTFVLFWSLSVLTLSIGAFFHREIISAPTVFVILAYFVLRARQLETARTTRIESSISHIRRAVDTNRPVPESLEAIGEVILQETHFARVSAYIDAFAVGLYHRQGERFLRVMENGYQKDTFEDRIIDFTQERGLKMKAAVESGALSLQKGASDQSWFLCIPLGRYVCLNLSDVHPQADHLAYESLEIVGRFHSGLLRFNDRLMKYALKSGFALERLRTIRGEGRWEEDLGLVFVDFRNENYRTHPKVEEEIIPALTRTVGLYGVRDTSRSDEICFVCFPELGESPLPLAHATAELAWKISEFMKNELPDLLIDSGLPPLHPAIAAGFGRMEVICDAVQVRIGGPMISEVRTLRDFAPNNGLLLHEGLRNRIAEQDKTRLGPPIEVETRRGKLTAYPERC